MARSASEIPHDRELDPLLASLLLASLLLHFGFVVYLQRMDWPRESDVPDQYWRLLPPAAPLFVPPRPATPPVAAAPGKVGRPVRGSRKASSGGGRLALVNALGALGGNPLADLLPGTDSARAFDHLGGPILDGESRVPRVTSLEIGTNRVGGSLQVQGPGSVRSGERSEERLVQPQVRIEKPRTPAGGGLSVEEMVALIREHLGAIRACYQGPLNRNHNLAGKITLRFVVATDGSVESVAIEDDTLGSAEVASCIRRRVAGWGFPAASRPSEFSFPFVFQSAD